MFRNKILPLALGSVATVSIFKLAAVEQKKEYEDFKRKYPEEEPVSRFNATGRYGYFTLERKEDKNTSPSESPRP